MLVPEDFLFMAVGGFSVTLSCDIRYRIPFASDACLNQKNWSKITFWHGACF